MCGWLLAGVSASLAPYISSPVGSNDVRPQRWRGSRRRGLGALLRAPLMEIINVIYRTLAYINVRYIKLNYVYLTISRNLTYMNVI